MWGITKIQASEKRVFMVSLRYPRLKTRQLIVIGLVLPVPGNEGANGLLGRVFGNGMNRAVSQSHSKCSVLHNAAQARQGSVGIVSQFLRLGPRNGVPGFDDQESIGSAVCEVGECQALHAFKSCSRPDEDSEIGHPIIGTLISIWTV